MILFSALLHINGLATTTANSKNIRTGVEKKGEPRVREKIATATAKTHHYKSSRSQEGPTRMSTQTHVRHSPTMNIYYTRMSIDDTSFEYGLLQ